MNQNNNRQTAFQDFKQSIGFEMEVDNYWIEKSDTIPWDNLVDQYKQLLGNTFQNDAVQLRTLLGAHLIHQEYQMSDEETIQLIRRNPYMQYFIGLPAYVDADPFPPASLTTFRNRLFSEMINGMNHLLKNNR